MLELGGSDAGSSLKSERESRPGGSPAPSFFTANRLASNRPRVTASFRSSLLLLEPTPDPVVGHDLADRLCLFRAGRPGDSSSRWARRGTLALHRTWPDYRHRARR